MRRRNRARHLAWQAGLSGIVFAAIWSLSFVVTKSALDDISPLWLAAFRLALAGGTLFLCKGLSILRFLYGLPLRSLMRVVFAGLLSQAAYLGASYWSLVNLPSSVVNIVVSSLPLVTLPFAWLLLHERIGVSGVMAFMLSMLGVMITLDDGIFIDGAKSGSAPATVLLVASVVALALGNVLVKPVISRVALVPFCALQFTAGGIAVALAALIFEPDSLPTWGIISEAASALVFLSLIGSILGTILWFQVLRSMPANAASSFFLLTPVFGIVLGVAIFGEAVTYPRIAGVFIISSAIALRLKDIPFFTRATVNAEYGSDR